MTMQSFVSVEADLRAALQRLERACDHRAELTPADLYCALEVVPGMREALCELDAARRQARDALASTPECVQVTDGMVHAALASIRPREYREHLRHPRNGPKTALRVEREIAEARQMIEAAMAVVPGGLTGQEACQQGVSAAPQERG